MKIPVNHTFWTVRAGLPRSFTLIRYGTSLAMLGPLDAGRFEVEHVLREMAARQADGARPRQ